MDQDQIVKMYRDMLVIRRFEEEAARLYTERKIGGFLHLYIGQEAVAVGTASVLEARDQVVTAYRCHGHYLARGGDVNAGMAELLGKATGCAQGRGGSMHFYDVKNNFFGGWGIVGAHLPVAAGMAFANKYNDSDAVTLVFLGDGAINIGPCHEAMALASIWKLPIIFIIENNQFAMGTPIEKTSATEDLSIRALGYPMARDSADGNDIFSVRSVIHSAIRRAREQTLPTLVEVKTYRYRGHSMADPATYRTKEELEEWKQKDPIQSLGSKLNGLGLESTRSKIDQEVESLIQEAVRFAEESPFPDPATALNYCQID